MLKTKDFYLLRVYNIKGKYLGVIDDVYINFYKGEIEGFLISNFLLYSKRNFVKVSDVISLGEVMIAKELSKKEGISFKSIKDMDIKDKNNVMKGILEELIIEEKYFLIKGLVMSSGIFDRIIKGKEILLLKECILGEEFILYYGNNEISLKTLPSKRKSC